MRGTQSSQGSGRNFGQGKVDIEAQEFAWEKGVRVLGRILNRASSMDEEGPVTHLWPHWHSPFSSPEEGGAEGKAPREARVIVQVRTEESSGVGVGGNGHN